MRDRTVRITRYGKNDREFAALRSCRENGRSSSSRRRRGCVFSDAGVNYCSGRPNQPWRPAKWRTGLGRRMFAGRQMGSRSRKTCMRSRLVKSVGSFGRRWNECRGGTAVVGTKENFVSRVHIGSSRALRVEQARSMARARSVTITELFGQSTCDCFHGERGAKEGNFVIDLDANPKFECVARAAHRIMRASQWNESCALALQKTH